MYPLMRYNHNKHLLSEGQIECKECLLGTDFIFENGEVYIIENDDPLTYSEAIMNRDSDKWLEVMKSEMDSIYTNQVWTLIDIPDGVIPIGCK